MCSSFLSAPITCVAYHISFFTAVYIHIYFASNFDCMTSLVHFLTYVNSYIPVFRATIEIMMTETERMEIIIRIVTQVGP